MSPLRSSPGARSSIPRRRRGGFSILELLVAISLLAVIAVLSWRGLDGVLATREAIVSRSDALRELTTVMAQLDDDLRRSWPMRLLELPSMEFDVGDDRSPPAVILLREAAEGSAAQMMRVIWRMRDGVLERGFAQMPASMPGAMPDVPPQPFWQVVTAGVESFELRGWVDGRGWVPAATLAVDLTRQAAEQAAQADQARQLAQVQRIQGQTGASGVTPTGGIRPVTVAAQQIVVRAIELTMVVRGERLVRVFALSD